MSTYYSNDKTTQIVLSILKANGIRKVIVSPGTTNIALVGSMQYDSFFELYSAVDERSAAYMACGLAYESGEPVVLSCTEATASRNYYPGLTEAYYRKLPVLAITGNHGIHEIGHLKPQVIDRSVISKDAVKLSINLGKCKDKNDEWDINVKTNMAILELTRDGGGPVHINLAFSSNYYGTKVLPSTRIIKRYSTNDNLPTLTNGRIAIFIGSHKPWTPSELQAIETFCDNHNAIVICDKTSGYTGKYRIDYAIIAAQVSYNSPTSTPDLLIHIGEISGDTYTQNKLKSKKTWRVNEDGKVCDTFRNLENLFYMSESYFFNYYNNKNIVNSNEYFEACKKEYNSITSKLPQIPFSNIWVAEFLSNKIPDKSYIHFGIFNSLRSWNFVNISANIHSSCNVGGFGIDGTLSTVLGASLAHPHQLHFIVLGDLAFFYDMNALGNRHWGNNIRILLINNGRGTEFRKFDHPCIVFGEKADPYMAASGHYSNKSKRLVSNYVSCLGFKYITASTKEEFESVFEEFITPKITEQPIIFEIFTDSRNESIAINSYRNIIKDNISQIKNKLKSTAKYLKGKI